MRVLNSYDLLKLNSPDLAVSGADNHVAVIHSRGGLDHTVTDRQFIIQFSCSAVKQTNIPRTVAVEDFAVSVFIVNTDR